MLNPQKYITIFIFLISTMVGYTQQLPPTTQYLINPYSLSPALAGYTGYSEAFLNYRNDWTGIYGSPRTFSVNGFGNIYQKKMWVGGEIMTDKTDIMSVFKANLSWTYKLRVESNQYLYFGAWTTYYQASVNTGKGIGINPNDPLIQNNNRLNSSVLNAGFGINYNWNKFNFGLSIPIVFGNNDEQKQNTTFKYKVKRQFQIHTSYMFELNKIWKLQTIGVIQKTDNQPTTIEVSAMPIYKGRLWGGMLYRNVGVIAVNIGGHIYNGFVFNYAYEIGMGGINKGSGGSHEITIGYRFKFAEYNYFKSKENATGSKRKNCKLRNVNYPEVKDFNYKRN